MIYFEEQYYLQNEKFSGLHEKHHLIAEWKSLSGTIGRKIVFGFDVLEAPQYEAEVMDIRDDGGLVLVLPDGSTVIENSGELRYIKS